MVKDWPTLSRRLLEDCMPIFRLHEEVRRSPRTGGSKPFFILEAPDWVNVIPVTPEGAVIFVHQYRHGVQEVTLEIPSGMVNEGSTPLDAARQELREETGYQAEELIPIGVVSPNPALFTNRCHTFLALDTRPAGPADPGPFEDLAMERVPLPQVSELIAMGRITHALVIAAFHFFDLYQRRPTAAHAA